MKNFTDDSFCMCYKKLLQPAIEKLINFDTKLYSKAVIIDFLGASFQPHFRRIWERIIILEMNIASRENLIPGETEVQKFNYFIAHFTDKQNLASIYKKYPSLQKIWQHVFNKTLASMKLCLERLGKDFTNILNSFNVPHNEKVKIIEIKPVGDYHNGMQCTTRITLKSSQCSYEIFYKPRSLAIDQGLRDFIAWWNHKFIIDLAVPMIINRGRYGWAKGIVAFACKHQEDVEKYYLRFGTLTALSYIFAATDLHVENLVASGAYPVLVDVETLFSCIFKNSPHQINYHLYHSLLLPTHCLRGAIELSPLSAKEKLTDIKILKKNNVQDTKIRMLPEYLKIARQKNQVKLNDRFVNFFDYKKFIISGFEAAIEFIFNNKESFFKTLNYCFKDARVRLIARNSEDYEKALYNQCHPRHLYKNTCTLALNRLASAHYNQKILAAEISQLKEGDIPYFNAAWDSCVIEFGNNKGIHQAMRKSSQQVIEKQLNKLSKSQIVQLIDDMHYAFKAYKLRDKLNPEHSPRLMKESKSFSLREVKDYLSQGVEIIYKQYKRDDGFIYWRRIFFNDNHSVSAGITDNYLYEGASGVLLMLHFYLKEIAYTKKNLQFKEKLFKQIRKELASFKSSKFGAYNGQLGIIYVLLHVGTAPVDIYHDVENVLAKLAFNLITIPFEKYKQLDIISGVAGMLLFLIEIHYFFKDFPLGQQIEKLAEYVFVILLKFGQSLIEENTSLGFSHGTAGISSALAAYLRYFEKHDEVAINIIQANVSRENQYRSEHGWEDLRKIKDIKNSTSWCHGSIGIAISRFYIRPFITELQFNDDLAIALANLRKSHLSQAPCHGSSGELFFLMACKNEISNILFEDIFEIFLSNLSQQNYCVEFGLPGEDNVGLMTGLAGILYGLMLKGNILPNILCPALSFLKIDK